MAFDFNFNLPAISNRTLDDAKQRKQILEYLYQLTEQLRYALNNLDERNLSSSLTQRIEAGAQAAEALNAADVETIRRIAQGAAANAVPKSGVIAAVNSSVETAKIDSKRIDIADYVEGETRALGVKADGTIVAFNSVQSE